MRPKNAEIVEIVPETPTVRTLRFDLAFDAVPGQYLMVWVRGVDEVPMSISYKDGITVQLVGEATRAIFDLEVGDGLGLRGPLGNGFSLLGDSILLVGGGVGAAPLAFLGEAAKERGIEVTTILGVRCCGDLIFRERFRRIGELVITTDDGSLGICGRASAGLSCLNLQEFHQIYLCGPEPMMADVIGRCRGMETKIQASIDRYFKCGMGICGSCSIDPSGIRPCVEGPVIRADELVGTEFGRYKRGPSGRKK
ncbi:dihydroorotate dehydrogenase electron transfer subunit [Methanotrichaceae archaeon M04Ac]|jgi:dihydroorotate dehydrogenase electron transfer subunit|uniref:Dihydroorotate dehydrogenase electron transfer subunit n=1 Tax=Candidatus Methanocrinis alkalitolerans TaxID=3033395 RepID=A0ABT5XE53_9EURY|nr:dihydroorotate dehydrogenase electron transfer subunit [Candidatus Methanocrinis alkalitolerans]MCR3883467.1 dihydroorotate dehydrogenase electron transfer subunit [Methanothrix sp.]MDF0592996.1 dihydroorotate dehydrogenase electron transfer subunit [Candidatus Methanocrinis alkalitolerans]